MNWTTKPIYQPWPSGETPIKPSLTINEDGPLGEAGDFTVEPYNSDNYGTIVSYDPNKDLVSREIIASDAETVTFKETDKVRSNKVPTHDPYANPNAHIYYSCDCGNILDPGTKRFAELNNAAMDNGWKIRWGHEYYEPFCPQCVKLKGIE